MRTSPAAVVSVLGGLLTGCAPGLPAPSISAVQPEWGYNGEETDVVIRGEDLYPQVLASGSQDFEVDRAFSAWLEDEDGVRFGLQDVGLQSYESLDATVPSGLEVGLYDVVVVGPTDDTARMSQVFEVRDTRADALQVEVDGFSYPVGTPVGVDILVLDPDGDPVAIDLGIELRVLETDPEVSLSFEDTLEGQEDLDDGEGISGTLGPTGSGYVALTSTEPSSVTLSAGPSDPSSGIREQVFFLEFTPGAVADIRVDLPRDDMTTVAGDEFGITLTLLDPDGFETQDETENVRIEEECRGGTVSQTDSVPDSKTVFVSPTAATYADSSTCTSNRFVVTSGSIVAYSESFLVEPAEVDEYEIEIFGKSVTAGEVFFVQVVARDAWGNRVTDHEGTLDFAISGREELSSFPGEFDCFDGFEDGEARCTVSLWEATLSTVLEVSSTDGTAGLSDSLEVLPGAGDDLLVEVDLSGGSPVAGQPFAVDLQVLDFFSNPVPFDPINTDAPDFSDDSGRLDCSWAANGPQELETFSCISELAEDEKVVTVDIDSLGLRRDSDVFEMVNGELGDVEITLSSSVVTAGSSVSVILEATDDYGNPYLSQSDADLTLSDLGNSVSPGSVSLEADGTLTVDLTFTTAIEGDVLIASHSVGGSGSSDSFDVVAAALDQLVVEVGGPWSWLEDELEVQVTAADPYGNPVATYAGSVTLSSDTGLFDDVDVSDFEDGAASVSIQPELAGLQDSITASDGTVQGTSDLFDVVDGGCNSGPTAVLTVGGSDPATLCRTGGVTASTSLSGTSSTAGDADLAAWHLYDGLHDWERQTSGSFSTIWESEGAFVAEMVVVDEDACGAEDSVVVYVADDDGEAAGEIEVDLDEGSLVAGSSSLGSTGMTITASDCSGDPVSSGTLYVRADLGSISSGTTTVSSSGLGLSFTTDSSGGADLGWSVAGEIHAGSPSVHVGVLSGAAYGSASVEVTGDAAPPTVLWVEPYGTTSEPFSEVEVVFSEDIRSNSVTSTRVSLEDADGDAVDISSASLSGDTLVISLDSQEDPAVDSFELTLSSAIHDSGGTGLDGEYDGTGADFSLIFGNVVDDSVDMSSCSPDTSTFRPDGDAGSGDEADSVTVSPVATDLPAWWEVTVSSSDGDEVLVDRQAASAASGDTWSWSGKSQDGLIVANGVYDVVFSGIDTSWNPGDTCSLKLLVDNRIRPPEEP